MNPSNVNSINEKNSPANQTKTSDAKPSDPTQKSNQSSTATDLNKSENMTDNKSKTSEAANQVKHPSQPTK